MVRVNNLESENNGDNAARSSNGGDQLAFRLQSDSDLANPQNRDAYGKKVDQAQVQPKGEQGVLTFDDPYGSEKQFIQQVGKELRESVGLAAGATSEQFYKKAGESMWQNYPKATAAEKRELLDSLGISKADAPHLTKEKMFEAYINRERKFAGVSNGASYSELEQASLKKYYQMHKNGTMPIDTD